MFSIHPVISIGANESKGLPAPVSKEGRRNFTAHWPSVCPRWLTGFGSREQSCCQPAGRLMMMMLSSCALSTARLSFCKSKNLCDALAALSALSRLYTGDIWKLSTIRLLHLPLSHGIWFLLLIKFRLCERKKHMGKVYLWWINCKGQRRPILNHPFREAFLPPTIFFFILKSAVSRFSPLLVGKLSSCWPPQTRTARKQTQGGSAASLWQQCWQERLAAWNWKGWKSEINSDTASIPVDRGALDVHDKRRLEKPSEEKATRTCVIDCIERQLKS